MRRATLHAKQPADCLAPGVWRERLQPGGCSLANAELGAEVQGGLTWMDAFTLGGKDDAFQLMVPDVRLPPNQYWPLHWHDCWIAVIILDGTCLIGDWQMQPGDVLISAAGVEYGPLVSGPTGCQMFEIFSKLHLQAGGYAPEYRDHPTLNGTDSRFIERAPINQHNKGRQVLPLDGAYGVFKGRLAAGAQWDLGEPDDPERGIMRDTRLAPGERIAAHSYDDWHAIFLLDGAMRVGAAELKRNDVLLIEPKARVDDIVAGPAGAQWLEVSRVAAGMPRRPVQ